MNEPDAGRNELAAREHQVEARTWVKIDSWHIVAVAQNVENKWIVETLCGLKLADTPEPTPRRPRQERTCENCYRLGDES